MILSASRAPVRVHKSRASNMGPAYQGLLYQRKAVKMLKALLPKSMKLEDGPWFYYQTIDTQSACQPDVLIHDEDFGYIIVIEIKNTWVPTAINKLKTLYCPVVEKVFDKPTHPILLCKNLTSESPRPQSTLSFALVSKDPVIQWLGRGSIQL